MTIPKYDDMMLPVLTYLSKLPEDKAATTKELNDHAAKYWDLSDEDKAETIASGLPRYVNNVQWACTYLKQAGCFVSPKRATYQIAQRGKDLLNSGNEKISQKELAVYPEFQEFLRRTRKPKDASSTALQDADDSSSESPEDAIETAFNSIDSALTFHSSGRLS